MGLPSLIRAAGAYRLKLALANPMVQQANPLPKPVSAMPKISQPVKPPTAPVAQTLKPPAPAKMPGVPAPMKPAMPAAMATKTADTVESVGRLVSLVGEDALMLAARKVLQGGTQAAKIPALVERAKAIEDPGYMPDSTYATVAKVLGNMAKVSSAQFSPVRSPETAAVWELDKRRIGEAFHAEGPGFRNDPPEEPTNIGTGNQVKDASAQMMSDKGTMMAMMMLSQNHNGIRQMTPATGSLDVHDGVSKAFSGMRVFEGSDTAPMNSPTEGALQA